MSLWDKIDDANSAPKYKIVDSSSANGSQLYENTTNNIVSGSVIGVYNYSSDEVPVGAGSGWVKKTEGSGGRSGRVTYEVLIAMKSQSDTLVLLDETGKPILDENDQYLQQG